MVLTCDDPSIRSRGGETDREAEREQRRADLIEYMSGRVTVETVTTNPDELTMMLWVTTPLGDQSFDWTPAAEDD